MTLSINYNEQRYLVGGRYDGEQYEIHRSDITLFIGS